MKKPVLFLLLLLCASVRATESEELYAPHHHSIGSLAFGWTRYFSDIADSYAKPSGVSLAVLAPIHIPKIDAHLKIKATYVNVQGDNFSGMAAVVNELLLGRIAYEEEYLFVLPQLGFGYRSESLFYKFDDAYFNVKLFVDLSVWIDYHLETFSAGVMLNFERDLPGADIGFIADNRINVSFVLTK
ncbi:hypothetical protein JXA02_11965 [candidate division KSB1 bacterium]|nr:hypothetical protein [candidate division KSB1 bacterium]RQW01895.1 MAG: hypothetical protein EH222_14305 [candidate division KSB1 bacterium]